MKSNIFTVFLDNAKLKYTGFSYKYYEEHPYKYSMLGLSMMLNDYGIANKGVRTQTKDEAVKELVPPYIAHINHDFVNVYGKTDENSQIYDANTYIKEYTYIGIVQDVDENGWCKIYQRNKFSVGETIEVMIPDGSNRNLKVLGMEDEDRHAVESAPHPKQEIWINFGEALERGYLLRRKE